MGYVHGVNSGRSTRCGFVEGIKMITKWIERIILVYIVADGLIGMYFKTKYQGLYSDGKIHMYSPILLLTIPTILICKLLGKSHIVESTEGVHKISWKEYNKLRREGF